MRAHHTAPVNVGSVIRGARCAARLTQAQLGAACGYSASAVSRIEAGRLHPGWETVAQMARVLGIPPDRLGVDPVPGGPPVATVPGGHIEEDAVRRRDLIAGALAAGATAAVGTAGPASASAGGDPAAGLERALFRLPAAEPQPMPALTRLLASARDDFRAARYAALATALPGLLAAAEATRDHATGHTREQAHAAVARAYVLAAELAVKQHSDVAWVAADRALTAARASGAPVPVGEAARMLAITMRRAGRGRDAVDLLTRESTALDPRHPRARAVRTSTLLTAAYSAASSGDRATALALLDEAQDATDEHTAQGLFTVEATRAQVDLYRIGALTVLGTPDESVRYASALDVDRMPTPERRARAWTDLARMWHALGDSGRAFGALRRVEQVAPQEVRRPALRALTADLLYGPARVEGLREFAARTGAVAV